MAPLDLDQLSEKRMALRRLLGLALGFCIASTAFAQGDRLRIDHIDIKRYEKEGTVRFYIDILDRENKVVPEQDPNKLLFLLNDDPLDPEAIKSVDLRQYDDVGEPIAIGVLFTNYAGFIPKSVGETSLFRFAKRGIVEFIRELRPNKDKVGLWLYNEQDALKLIQPFTLNMGTAAEVVEELDDTKLAQTDDETGDDGRVQTPDFYRYFDQVISKMAEEEDLPRRRILILVSDGVGEYTTKRQKLLDRKLSSTIEAAKDANIKIYAFGATLQEDAFMPSISRAAEGTKGIYQRIANDEPESLESAIRELAPQLKKQYVVDLIAPGLPSDEKVRFRVDGETPNGESVSGVYAKPLQLPETPTNWKRILQMVGWSVGGLLGLFLLVWLVKQVVTWRNARPQEVYVQEQHVYDGPDRGKLIVRSGHMAGTEFPLLEDVSTIGSLDGNHIVLYDESVSKRHAGIRIEDMRYELADFGSTNHTWVNGRKINKQFLRDGDEIRVGSVELEFRLK